MKGKLDQGGGLVWRYKDANNYYIARMNPLEDNFRVYKEVAGKADPTRHGRHEGDLRHGTLSELSTRATISDASSMASCTWT